MSHNRAPRTQRALVLQGGGALGAYEAGVLKVLCKKLHEEDKENKREDSLLFDIVAGTSIGATNAAILVRQFLETRSWVK
ncbi:MAG: patatin-like phospholipase family protein, partial [Nitrososphaeraceae archaeon]